MNATGEQSRLAVGLGALVLFTVAVLLFGAGVPVRDAAVIRAERCVEAIRERVCADRGFSQTAALASCSGWSLASWMSVDGHVGRFVVEVEWLDLAGLRVGSYRREISATSCAARK